ncbi:hypothetical protein BDA96_07G025400 [Sorghum bicolor]|uniref:Embryo surrounding factor 1 brassicaceae domain-containing protein n=1 Tax=Sorghum bicolor TaxID=4558 RepID=A0A921QKP9_SORBI|nr:hypothetical protein BDA96_07G025400 [Sorghum bicolor]
MAGRMATIVVMLMLTLGCFAVLSQCQHTNPVGSDRRVDCGCIKLLPNTVWCKFSTCFCCWYHGGNRKTLCFETMTGCKNYCC